MKFKVTIGWLTVKVTVDHRDEAIKAARKIIAHEWPRLYDLVYSARENRFLVEEIKCFSMDM